MGEYDSAVALALRLIKKKGKLITVRNVTVAAPADSNKPWYPGAGTNVDQSVYGVFLDYAQRYIDGETIKTGDQQVYLPSTDVTGAPVTPKVDGLILRGSEVWKILAVSPLKPADQLIIHTVQVRQ